MRVAEEVFIVLERSFKDPEDIAAKSIGSW